MAYFSMEKPQSIISAEPFHFWVRNGIRWVQFAKVAKSSWISVNDENNSI